jgi:hypothetical protein
MKHGWISILASVVLVASVVMLAASKAAAQNVSDYRSKQSGNWSDPSTWEHYDGTTWVNATAAPTHTDGVITIRNGHTVTITASVTVDQVVVEAGGQVTVNSGGTFSTNDGAGHELTIYGTFLHSGTVPNPMNGGGVLASGGIYIHNTTSSAVRMLTFFGSNIDANSTFIYRDAGVAVSFSGRTYGNLTFESTSSWTVKPKGASPLTVQGDFTIGNNVTLDVSGFSGDINIAGNWTNNGTFIAGTGTVTFNGTGISSYGGSSTTTFNNLTINSGATLDIGTNTIFNISGTMTNNGTLKQTKTVNAANTVFLNISTDKYYGVEIKPGSNNLGSTTVSIRGNQTCGTGGTLPDAVKRCYDIVPSNQLESTIRFYYRSAEANSNTAPNVYHWNSSTSTWDLQTLVGRGGSGEGMYVEASGISSYSPFTLKDNQPTAITLSSFTARPSSSHSASLNWVAVIAFTLAGLVGAGAQYFWVYEDAPRWCESCPRAFLLSLSHPHRIYVYGSMWLRD